MKQLPVIGTAIDAYTFVWENRRDFLLLAFLPIVIGAIADTVLRGFLVPDADVPAEPGAADLTQPRLGALVSAFVTLVLYVMFAVAWHRRFLAEEQTTVGAALRWGPRHMRFLTRFFALVLFMVAVGFGVGGSLTIGGEAGPGPLRLLLLIGALVGTLLVYSRLLLIFPAAALDEKVSPLDSWRLTRGNSWRMVGISFLPIVPIWIASIFVAVPVLSGIAGLGLQGSLTATLVASLIEQAFVFAGVAVTVSALSIAYRDFKAAASTSTAVTPTSSSE